MKSIIQEGSCIAKAVEQGWQKAGKPINFSIKVLEEETKNFLGMVKKPAKVAIFFEEKDVQKRKMDIKQAIGVREGAGREKQAQQEQKSRAQQKPSQFQQKQSQKQFQQQERKRELPTRELPTAVTTPGEAAQPRKFIWTEEMAENAKKWTCDVLNAMQLGNIKFSTTTSYNSIRFHFDTPLVSDPRSQKILFSNLAFLLMQTMRYKFRKPLRNLKAIFTTD